METVSTVPARSNEGPSGRRSGPPRRRRGTLRLVLRGLGKTFISAGVLIFLFVAYQLWGTNIAESRDQNALEKQFSRVLTPPAAAAEAPPVTTPRALGDATAFIEIPKIGVEKYVVEGVGTEDLKKGPGHYPDTPMPGEPGNAAIAGHRTTYGAPFSDLEKLTAGDQILVTTHAGKFRYDFESATVVSPSESSVLDNTEDNRLTLTTCHPKFSAAQRLIIVAKLGSPVVEPPPPAAGAEPPPPPMQISAGLSGADASRGPAIAWGALAALIWALTWWIGRWWKRWPAYLLGTPVFLVTLFVFFENFSRLLPANL